MTNTMLLPFLSCEGEDPVRGCMTSPGRRSWTAPLAHGGKGLLCPKHRPYLLRTFNPGRQLHRIEEAFGGAMTFPTELSHFPAYGIKSQGWTLQGLQP